jgi:hypothetical protein
MYLFPRIAPRTYARGTQVRYIHRSDAGQQDVIIHFTLTALEKLL